MRRWRKLGQVYDAPPCHEKLLTHAANTVAVQIDGDLYRVFFNGRDAQNRSSIGYVDFDMAARQVVGRCDAPVFGFGPDGGYRSHGVSIGNCYAVGSERFIGFMGWHSPEDGHWRGEIGRLRLHDDLSLSIASDEPMLGIGEEDPISLSYPFVIADPAGGWRMWYGSTRSWDAGNGEMLHVIRDAHSNDGARWRPGPHVVPFALGTAQAFSRPTVIRDGDGYAMWFSYRGAGNRYRIGHATSADGNDWHWQPPDIDTSAEGWDSEMIEYPFVFDHAGARYMLYNGNGYGRTGFGLAVLDG